MIDTCGSFKPEFLIGFLAFLAGLTLLIIGIVLETQSPNLEEMSKIFNESMERAVVVNNIMMLGSLLITVGLFVVLLAFLCCGALRKSRGMLITFCVIMSIMIIIQVIVTCLQFAAKPAFQKLTFEDYENDLMTNHSLITSEKCNDVNFFEKKFKCCFNETITILCSKTGAAQQAHCKPNQPDWKPQCKDVTVWELIMELSQPFGFAYLFIAILEVAAIIFSGTRIYLISKERSQYTAYT